MKYEYQVISYNKNAHRCHDQIKHLGYFFTQYDAYDFARKQKAAGREIIVRSAH